MNSKLLLLAFLVFALGLNSCMDCISGEGEQVKRQKSPGEYEKITVNTAMDVKLEQGDSCAIKVRGYENLVENLVFKQRGERLIIDTDKCISGRNNLELVVVFRTLQEIEVNGSANVSSDEIIKGDELEVEIKGSGDLDLKLYVDDLDVDIRGSGDAVLRGTTQNLVVDVNGSGNVNAQDLLTDVCEVDISGSGDCSVNVQERLEADINGSGTIHYTGMVRDIQTDINGSGDIIRKK